MNTALIIILSVVAVSSLVGVFARRKDEPGDVDRGRAPVWPCNGLVSHGRRDLHYVHVSRRQRLGLFERSSNLLHNHLWRAGLYNLFFPAPCHLEIGQAAQPAHAA